MKKEIREQLKNAIQFKPIETNEGIYLCYNKESFTYKEQRLPLSYIDYTDEEKNAEKLIVMFKDVPIFEIDTNYNKDDFENLFQMKFFYFRETDEFSEDQYKPFLAYEIRKSVGALRFWVPCNHADRDINDYYYDDCSEEDKYMILLRDAIKYSMAAMKDDQLNTLYELTGEKNAVYKFGETLAKLYPGLLMRFKNIPSVVQYNLPLYLEQIKKKKTDLLNGRERFEAIVIGKKNDIISLNSNNVDHTDYGMLLFNVNRYYNVSLQLLEKDEKAVIEMQKEQPVGKKKEKNKK